MRLSACVASSALLCALLLTGCSLSTSAGPSTVSGVAIQGVVHGGQQSIVGSKVYLMEATTGGYYSYSSSSQSTVGSGFSLPFGVAVDRSGNVYVADYNNALVKEIPLSCITGTNDSTCVVTLGGGFSSPFGVAVDGSGNVYVADAANRAVKEIPLSCITGTNDSTCVVTLGGGFGAPFGVAVDGSGNVFVADDSTVSVEEIPLSCITGANTSACVVTLGSGFSTPQGVAVDGSGNVFVADTGHNLVKEIPLSCITGANTSACVNTLGSGFSAPTSVAVDGSGNVFVADTVHSLVKEILAGGYTTVNTLGSGFNHPSGVAVDGSGNVYVGDYGNSRVLKETPTGTRQASKSLLNSTAGLDSIGYYVTTDSNGAFSISGDYTCDANAQSYLYVLGGNSGGNGANSGIGLMAALGQCPGSAPLTYATSVPFIYVNEVSTVAAAYAMAGYATDATHVSRSNSTLATTGLANAFANAGNLASISTGVANTVTPSNASGVVPQTEINTLANILSSCINTSGPGSTNCTTLFTNAESAGSSGTAPTDTATAAINIAHNPGTVNMSNLYGLQAGVAAPFAPNLGSAPNDFTVGLKFTGNGLGQPQGIGIDGSGNVWVANNVNSGTNGVSVFTSSGAVATTPASPLSGNGMNAPASIAFDTSGNAWIANQDNRGTNGVSEFTSSGGVAGSSPFSGNSMNVPVAIAIDVSGNAWVANLGGGSTPQGISVFISSGLAATTSNSTLTSANSPLNGNGLNTDAAIAFDISGNAWVANGQGSNGISVFTSSGGVATTPASPLSGNGLNSSWGIAIDGSGNAWVPNCAGACYGSGSGSLSEFTSSGGVAGSSPFSGNGMNGPYAIAIDGSGNAWVANSTSAHLSEFSNGGSGLSPNGLGTAFGSSGVAYAIAIDGSGNVWTADYNNSILIELVGAATPVVTPVVANLLAPYGAAAVNLP